MKSKIGALAVLVALSSLVMMLGYQKYAPQRAAKEPAVAIPEIRIEPSQPIVVPRRAHRVAPEEKPAVASEVTLFVARPVHDEMKLVPIRRTTEESTPLAALQALASYEPSGREERTLPKGTKVLGLSVSPTGTATADFSHEIVDNFPGGSHTEQVLLASIANTLTQYPSIKRVAITVDGKPVDSIGGHIELDEPLERDTSLIDSTPDR